MTPTSPQALACPVRPLRSPGSRQPALAPRSGLAPGPAAAAGHADPRATSATTRACAWLRCARRSSTPCRALCRARPYEQVTFTFVARLAGVTAADVRRCFATKAEMVLAALRRPSTFPPEGGALARLGRRDRDALARVLGVRRQRDHPAPRLRRRPGRPATRRRPRGPRDRPRHRALRSPGAGARRLPARPPGLCAAPRPGDQPVRAPPGAAGLGRPRDHRRLGRPGARLLPPGCASAARPSEPGAPSRAARATGVPTLAG